MLKHIVNYENKTETKPKQHIVLRSSLLIPGKLLRMNHLIHTYPCHSVFNCDYLQKLPRFCFSDAVCVVTGSVPAGSEQLRSLRCSVIVANGKEKKKHFVILKLHSALHTFNYFCYF